jgi:acyl dehydratase
MGKYALDELIEHVGETLGESRPHTVTQEQVNLFAEATGDHQWIHVDPERARSGPFGTTIAHGYLTLSLVPMLMKECLTLTGTGMSINYGLNKLRFPAPVPVGSEVQMKAKLNGVEETDGGVQILVGFEIGVVGATKPSAAGEAIFRHYRG